MIEFLQNLLARDLGATEDIKLVMPRLPSLFEPSTDIQDIQVKAAPWSPVTEEWSPETEEIPSQNYPPLVSYMKRERVEAGEIQKDWRNLDLPSVDKTIRNTNRHTQPKRPSDPERTVDSVPRVDETISQKGRKKLTGLTRQEHESEMEEERVEAGEIQKDRCNLDMQSLDNTIRNTIRHTQTEHPADPELLVNNVPQIDETLSYKGKKKLTGLIIQGHISEVEEERVDVGEIQRDRSNPDMQSVDKTIRNTNRHTQPKRPSDPERTVDSIPRIDETIFQKGRKKLTGLTRQEHMSKIEEDKGLNQVSYKDIREKPQKSSSNRLDGHHLFIENSMITKYVERTLSRDIARREEHGRRSNIIPSTFVQSIPYGIETVRLPGQDTRSYEAERKEAPTINVTIGRIEVRATTTQVQNRPKQKAPSLMSLDDYLKRRSGGSR